MFHIDSTYRFARLISTADLDSFGGDFHDIRSLRDEWDLIVGDDDNGLVRI